MYPFKLTEDRTVLDDVLIGSEQNLELAHPQLNLQSTTLRRVALV